VVAGLHYVIFTKLEYQIQIIKINLLSSLKIVKIIQNKRYKTSGQALNPIIENDPRVDVPASLAKAGSTN